MKSTKRMLCLLLCTAMALSLLAACGGQGEETQHTADTTETTTAPTAVPTTIPETTVPETTVPETTVPEPTVPPFVVDGSYTYTVDEFLKLLEQRLVENDCPVYLQYNSEFSPDDGNILVVSYWLYDSVSGERLSLIINETEHSAYFDFHCDINSGEVLSVRIIDEMNHPIIKQFTAICLSIIDPTIEGDIYDMLTSREPVGVLYFLYVYMMPGNGVVYDMTVMEDGDALMYDLKISAENYFKASSPEWIDDVYRTQPTE